MPPRLRWLGAGPPPGQTAPHMNQEPAALAARTTYARAVAKPVSRGVEGGVSARSAAKTTAQLWTPGSPVVPFVGPTVKAVALKSYPGLPILARGSGAPRGSLGSSGFGPCAGSGRVADPGFAPGEAPS